MNIREFSRHIGVSHPAVLKACKTGRLRRSLTRDSNGRVTGIDPVLGVEEWKAKTRLSPAERRAATTVSKAGPAVVAPLVDRLSSLMAAVQADTHAVAVRFLPAIVEGAREALEAAGRPATNEAIGEAMDLDDDDAGVNLTGELLDAVADPDMTLDAIREVARQAGRAAVAARGAADGQP